MNYLQLVNDFMIETDMDDQIVTVTGQIDDGLKATIWIRDAWLQIQRNEKWEWLWYEGTLTTVASQSTYVYTDITTDDLDRSSLRLPAESKYIHEYGIEAIRFDTATGSPSIVWLAISNYAREQGAEWAGLYVTANREYNQIYSTMTNRYMPRMEPKVGLTN